MLIQQSETAIAAYYDHVPKIAQAREQQIIDVMQPGYDYTIGELAKLTGLDKSNVSARRNAMLKDDRDNRIERGSDRKCTISKITCETVRLPTPFQLEFTSARGFSNA